MTAETSPDIASLAAKALSDPTSLTPDQIQAIAASALRQAEAPTRNPPEGGKVLGWRNRLIADMDAGQLIQTINEMGHVLLTAHTNHLQATEVWKALDPEPAKG